MRAVRGLVWLVCGKARWQPLFRRLHQLALAGLNYGRSEVADSGEAWALDYARSVVPDASVVFDVGANLGDWTIAAQRTWPGATVHAFEPAGDIYRQLTARVDAVCVQAAVGDAEGEAVLYAVAGVSGLSSLHDRDLAAHSMTMSPAGSVPVTTVDSYCAENGIERIDYLKIDAEGHDLAVIQGASGTIDRGVRFIQFEFGGCNIDSRTFLRDFVRLLEPDYRIYRMLTDGLAPLDWTERDEVFVTSNFLAERVGVPGWASSLHPDHQP